LRRRVLVFVVSLILAYFVFPMFVGQVFAESEKAKVTSCSSYVQHESYQAIFSGTKYIGDFIHVVGEVQNVVEQNIKIDEIKAVFFDENDAVINAGPIHTSVSPLDILAPGQKSPFEVILLNEEASGRVSKFEVSVESATTSESPANLEILNHRSSVLYGTFYVVGEIENSGSKNVDNTKLFATFYDEHGTVIGADFTYGSTSGLEILVAGQKSPFTLNNYGRKGITDQIKSYSLSVEGSITAKEPYREFEVLNVSSNINILGDYELSGEVRNVGETDATFVKVLAIFHDSNGDLVDSGFGFTDPTDLAAGQTGTFLIFTSNAALSSEIASYNLQVECSEFTASALIPESSSAPPSPSVSVLPSSSPSVSVLPSSSPSASTSPFSTVTPSESNKLGDSTTMLFAVGAVVIVIVVSALAFIAHRRARLK
jgi:hypothetical protein